MWLRFVTAENGESRAFEDPSSALSTVVRHLKLKWRDNEEGGEQAS